MKYPSLILILGICILFTGCETARVSSQIPQRTEATFSAPIAKVWPLVVSEVGLQYPTRVIEKDSGLISTDWVTLQAGFNNMYAQRWVFPPGGFLATWNGLRMNMKVQAREIEPGKTAVTINCHFEAFENNVQKTWIVAQSNGSIENDILTTIERKLPAALAAPDPAPVSTSTMARSPADGLLELKKLLDAGAITPAEYEAKRKSLIEKL